MKGIRNLIVFCGLFFVCTSFQLNTQDYYTALSSEDFEVINSQYKLFKKETELSSLDKARFGALLMKRSGYLSSPFDKLKAFNQGKEMLENQIKIFPENVEYRFIRFIIQEHAPQFLKYNNHLKEDRIMIVRQFNYLKSSALKKIIKDYSKSSQSLNLQ